MYTNIISKTEWLLSCQIEIVLKISNEKIICTQIYLFCSNDCISDYSTQTVISNSIKKYTLSGKPSNVLQIIRWTMKYVRYKNLLIWTYERNILWIDEIDVLYIVEYRQVALNIMSYFVWYIC